MATQTLSIDIRLTPCVARRGEVLVLWTRNEQQHAQHNTFATRRHDPKHLRRKMWLRPETFVLDHMTVQKTFRQSRLHCPFAGERFPGGARRSVVCIHELCESGMLLTRVGGCDGNFELRHDTGKSSTPGNCTTHSYHTMSTCVKVVAIFLGDLGSQTQTRMMRRARTSRRKKKKRCGSQRHRKGFLLLRTRFFVS